MKLYIKPNTKFEKDKEKEKQIIKETKQKDEPIHKLVEGIHKLQLRENYCRDGTYDETYVASLYDSLYAYNKIEEMCISCPYCGFEFQTDYDDEINEVCCPECGEIFEIDWDDDSEEK